jgi:hypothetical protein
VRRAAYDEQIDIREIVNRKLSGFDNSVRRAEFSGDIMGQLFGMTEL